MRIQIVAWALLISCAAAAQSSFTQSWRATTRGKHALTQHADSAGGGNWQLTALTDRIGSNDSTFFFQDTVLTAAQAGQPIRLDACMLFDEAHSPGARGGLWIKVYCANAQHNVYMCTDEVNRRFRYCMGPYVLYLTEFTLPADAQRVEYGFGLKGAGWLKVRRLSLQIGAETTGTGYTFEPQNVANGMEEKCEGGRGKKGKKCCSKRSGKKHRH